MLAQDDLTYLFLPGPLCDEMLFAYPLERLRWHSIQVDLTQDNTIEGMAQRALNSAPDQFALIGLSMGGIVALDIIRQAPERVLSAILFNTPYQPMDAERQTRYHTYIDMAQGGRLPDVVSAMIDSGLVSELHASIDPNLIEQVHDMAQRVGAGAFVNQANALLTRRDYTPVLENCPCFVQVVSGDMDKLVDWTIGEQMAALLPHSKFDMLNNCGHLSPLEQPFATIKLLQAWRQRFALENIAEAEEENAEESD